MSLPTAVAPVGPLMLQVPKRQSLVRPVAHCSALVGGVDVDSSPQAVKSVAAMASVAKIFIVIEILVFLF
jgi:hypothetical protein